ncbi:hypothetical protein J2Y69_002113 [Microbacterium resistens]|uniref:Uncharacterized protein n=1 Tax=Microbacterium resistens TaxID=156977 RepID=A0ABU1SD37_9MICO|nr:hypothetical protein [Microbacterium resistens]MDR6867509.1 hypothetical protein [Microbacterium resistens]
MSDFTPTIEQLRLAYWRYVYEHSTKPGRDADAEFNRGLAAHDAEVRAERDALRAAIQEVRRDLAIGGFPLSHYQERLSRAIDPKESDVGMADEPNWERTLGPDLTGVVYERTKATPTRPAGPWVPVKQEGTEQ